jgi:hypothetical protein
MGCRGEKDNLEKKIGREEMEEEREMKVKMDDDYDGWVMRI